MVKRSNIKITVLKMLNSEDIYDTRPADMAEWYENKCPLYKEGDEFIIDDPTKVPQGFCSWAWADIHKDVIHLMFQGDFDIPDGWMSRKGVNYACCTDGLRPVFFKIERI